MSPAEKRFNARRRRAEAEILPDALAAHGDRCVQLLDQAYRDLIANWPAADGGARESAWRGFPPPAARWAEILDNVRAAVHSASVRVLIDENEDSPDLVSLLCGRSLVAAATFLRVTAGQLEDATEDIVESRLLDLDPIVFGVIEGGIAEAYGISAELVELVETQSWDDLLEWYRSEQVEPEPDNLHEIAGSSAATSTRTWFPIIEHDASTLLDSGVLVVPWGEPARHDISQPATLAIPDNPPFPVSDETLVVEIASDPRPAAFRLQGRDRLRRSSETAVRRLERELREQVRCDRVARGRSQHLHDFGTRCDGFLGSFESVLRIQVKTCDMSRKPLTSPEFGPGTVDGGPLVWFLAGVEPALQGSCTRWTVGARLPRTSPSPCSPEDLKSWCPDLDMSWGWATALEKLVSLWLAASDGCQLVDIDAADVKEKWTALLGRRTSIPIFPSWAARPGEVSSGFSSLWDKLTMRDSARAQTELGEVVRARPDRRPDESPTSSSRDREFCGSC